jgi:hypothetical protein
MARLFETVTVANFPDMNQFPTSYFSWNIGKETGMLSFRDANIEVTMYRPIRCCKYLVPFMQALTLGPFTPLRGHQ